jgi:hypothetical protein
MKIGNDVIEKFYEKSVLPLVQRKDAEHDLLVVPRAGQDTDLIILVG